MNQKNQIDILIGKFLSGNATSDDVKKLERWNNLSSENFRLFEKSKKAWEISDHYISETGLQRDKLNLETHYSRYLSEKVRKISRQSFIYKLAAILAFPITLIISWYLMERNVSSPAVEEQFCEIISPKGHVSKAILPDGTEVWINTGSSLVYETSTFNSTMREVQLTGEAYFEVTSSPDKPFTVVTPHVNVKVTGTSFNVNAYPTSPEFETVLAEGKIQLQFKSGTNAYLEMEPNQRIIYNGKSHKYNLQQVDAEIYSSWRNGEIIFKDATLNDLVKELERIYDIRFHMQPANLGELRFRGMFSYNNNLIEALEKIKKSSNADYYIENKEVWLKKSN